MSEWIKCSDKLPEIGECVLAAFLGSIEILILIDDMNFYDPDYVRNSYGRWYASRSSFPVTHWMNLPELPDEN